MQKYPALTDITLAGVIEALRFIIRVRNSEDVTNFNNLPQIFIQGRKVGKVPTSSVDVDTTDRVGDFNYDINFIYLCVDDSGASWRRVALASW